jgi:Spy/CpxP family protein refolding chaperone
MELDQLMRAESPDRALIDKKMRELSDARLAAEKFQFDHQLTMRNALSPEQKKKLEDWRKEMRQNRMQRGPGFGPRRGPGGFGPAQPPNPPASPAPPAPPNNPDGL